MRGLRLTFNVAETQSSSVDIRRGGITGTASSGRIAGGRRRQGRRGKGRGRRGRRLRLQPAE